MVFLDGKTTMFGKTDATFLNSITRVTICVIFERNISKSPSLQKTNFGELNFPEKTGRYRDGDYYAAIFKDFSRVLKNI